MTVETHAHHVTGAPSRPRSTCSTRHAPTNVQDAGLSNATSLEAAGTSLDALAATQEHMTWELLWIRIRILAEMQQGRRLRRNSVHGGTMRPRIEQLVLDAKASVEPASSLQTSLRPSASPRGSPRHRRLTTALIFAAGQHPAGSVVPDDLGEPPGRWPRTC